eukprot:TRINITY_DN3238_c0_g1_i1.p1 TRINITY_DN3238_c0_g1~~TRINITY_DN3238_c0_g1_i1.p1  ORF type:complete len:465 (-),score=90.52 TRINITY_DN3238_c0_g1_i1:29-1423(-)
MDDNIIAAKYQEIEEVLLTDRDSEERNDCLERGVKWESFVDVHITREDLELIKDFLNPPLDRADIMRKHGKKYARLFMMLLSRLKTTEDLRYTATLVHDTLLEVPHSWQYFYELHSEKPVPGVPDLPFGPIFALLARKDDDPYILSVGGAILTHFLSSFPKVRTDMVESAMHWFIKKVQEDPESSNYVRVQLRVLENLRVLLKVSKYRFIFARESGVEPIFELTKVNEEETLGAGKLEVLYQALYCLWLLSFHEQVQKTMAVPLLFTNLCHLLRVCQGRDKVVRVTLSILKNLSHGKDNKRTMLSCGLDRILLILKNKNTLMADKDVVEDIEKLETMLDRLRDALTSYDVYFTEVKNRTLEWSSPVHKSEKFWTENCFKIEGSELLSMLKEILETETNPNLLCVVCWDLGEFMKAHPQGKSVLQQLKMHVPLAKLLEHPDAAVKNHSLVTLQKLMITNWGNLTG